MDTRFRDEGYAVTFSEEPFGAFLTIVKRGEVVGQVVVGIAHGDPHSVATIDVRRFRPHELQHIATADEFPADSAAHVSSDASSGSE